MGRPAYHRDYPALPAIEPSALVGLLPLQQSRRHHPARLRIRIVRPPARSRQPRHGVSGEAQREIPRNGRLSRRPQARTARRFEMTDEGRGCSEHYAVLAALFDRKRNPSWLVFWRRKRLQLTRKRRAVHDALAGDWRTACAAKIAGVSRPTVDLCKKIFKTHFAQCHTAWKCDFAF